MKTGHKYHVNPPYALIVANPKGSKRRAKKRRNPAPGSSRPGIFVIRKPKRNPSTKNSSVMKTRRRHHRSKRRNPAKLRHVLLMNSPKRRRHSKRSLFSRNPMKKHRSRSRSRGRSRNPMSRRSAPRRMGRRSHRRFRNPIPGVVSDLFGPDMLTFAGGVVIANVGTSMIMNRLVAGNPTTGQRPFNLPGVDYSMLGTTNAAQFYSKNAWLLAAYKVVIGGAAGYLLRHQSPRLSRGIMVGTVATAISDVLKNTGVLTASGALQWPAASTAGTGRYFPGGVGSNYRPRIGFVPGTNPIFTNPAQGFLTASNVPRPRGMGARVGPSTITGTMESAEGSFRGAN